MHIYFVGIGGSGLSSFALLGHQAGFTVSGSDRQDGSYIRYLKEHGVTEIGIDATDAHIASVHQKQPIDWVVYSSAVSMEQDESPILRFSRHHHIRTTKRDEYLNMLLKQKQQKLIALAGTHGKSTTTAMVVWLCKELGMPFSYSLGAKISFGELGRFDKNGEYFVYECDEFDRNFLAYSPFISGITGLSWDHHEIFPTREDYNQAFRDFIGQSAHTIAYSSDLEYLGLDPSDAVTVLDKSTSAISGIKLAGEFNRQDAWLAVHIVGRMTGQPMDVLQEIVDRFPGLKQRMELLAPNVYTNYAHTPEKIKGGMSAALEIAKANNQELVVAYEPLTNRRQHYIKDEYKDCFKGAKKLYWIPSYLAREDSNLPILTPAELISHLSDPSIAEPAKMDDTLLEHIHGHLEQGALVVAMGASGPGSMDEWLRQHFVQ